MTGNGFKKMKGKKKLKIAENLESVRQELADYPFHPLTLDKKYFPIENTPLTISFNHSSKMVQQVFRPVGSMQIKHKISTPGNVSKNK